MSDQPAETTRLLDKVLAAVSSIRYGSVNIVIHDSKVIQIEKIEKVRLDKADRQTGGSFRTKAPSTRQLERQG